MKRIRCAATRPAPPTAGGSSPATSMPSSPTISAVVTCSYSNEPGVDVPDPLTLPLHETAIVTTAVITFAGIVRWVQAQRNLTAGNPDAVRVPLARRVARPP